MNPPKAIVFDLGKVLLDFDYHRAARALAPLSDVAADEFKRQLDQSPLLHQYESGRLDTPGFLAEVRRLTGYRGTLDQFAAAFGDIFTEIPSMISLHGSLRSRGVPTYIFSNTNELAVGHIRRQYPFFHHFDGYVFSHEAGCMKPATPIYEAVERLTGHRGADLLYLDDRAENIAAGAARGWRTVLHTDHAATPALVHGHLGWH